MFPRPLVYFRALQSIPGRWKGPEWKELVDEERRQVPCLEETVGETVDSPSFLRTGEENRKGVRSFFR